MTAFAYGLGTLGRDMLAAMVSLFLMFYLTDVLGISGAELIAVTVVMVAMRIFDAVNDPFMGMIVDNTRSRWGKFRPWMGLGALLWAVAGVLMFTDFGVTGWGFVAVFTLTYLVFEVAYTINDISYWGMLPSLTRDQRQRERIGVAARICANVGLFSVVVGIVPLTKWLGERTGSLQQGWFWFAVLAAGGMLMFQALPLVFAREQVLVDSGNTGLKGLWRAIVANDQLMWTTLGMTLFMTGYTLTTSLGLYYFKYVFGDEDAYSTFALVLGVTQIASLALFPLVSRYVRRFRIHLGATAMMVLGYVVFYFADGDLGIVAVAGVLLFAGQGAIQLLMVMFIADSAEYGQWKLGRRNEAVTFALQPFIYKFSNALATGVVGATVVVSGISDAASSADLDADGRLVIKVAMMGLPLVLVVVSYLILRARYRLDEVTYADIVGELRRRETPLH
ncbi:glycoside-pentoside-hexuronide (GPH):cation symporter [Tessaracoccus oleiagri]|uniref:Lactose/raffinose/galactose permease n=1 Tax=Tessaracoccus oleiagri TaxID=686624 RepID=A0A1G9LP04_9ACTN|nr:glycoside-pentoside-hexuronide (GPH):cation symporter [Tessaracoccus oleiagri]SDL63245.1 lactose/raffinose/galactose permease [Tessaracoccus oleiagri]